MTENKPAIIMCMRVEFLNERDPDSRDVPCSRCGAMVGYTPPSLPMWPAMNNGEVQIVFVPKDLRVMCGRCCVLVADEAGDWATAAQLRHAIFKLEGTEVP